MEDNNSDWIRENRERLGLSRKELAEKAGISETYVAKLEQGIKTASPRLRVKLKRVFGFELVDGEASYNIGDIIKVSGISFRIVDLTLSYKKAPTVELRSLIEELEN
jgi:ribosome-binding protein aMBF1 (putative translation factor)